MANVVTDEPEAEPVEMLTGPAIREAILALIPDDQNIQRDIRIHDGLADIAIKWRTLRWSTSMALHNQAPGEIAQQVVAQFGEWVRTSIRNRGNSPRYEQVVHEMQMWANQNPEKAQWLVKRPSNKTAIDAPETEEAA